MKTLPELTNGIQAITRSRGLGLLRNALHLRATIPSRRLALALFFVLSAATLTPPCAAIPFQWEYTGILNTARSSHTATLLGNGTVLVVGGVNTGHAGLVSAELYDPATGNWTATGNLNRARAYHTATLLLDGRVLVAAGDFAATAELYDPATGAWTLTGSLNVGPRGAHAATLLGDGRVLVAGGFNDLTSAELYDPGTGTWTLTGSLNTGRIYHTATLLPDGRVLVAGMYNDDSAEIYDPATGRWNYTGSMHNSRWMHTATLLPDGRVLVVGGELAEASAELYDPATGNWIVTGSLRNGRRTHGAALLTGGRVIVTGGEDVDYHKLASAELYDPVMRTWTFTGSLNIARGWCPATLLTNGKVLVEGGHGNGAVYLDSAELYDPGIGVTRNIQGFGALDNNGNEVTFRFRAAQTNENARLGYFYFCDVAGGLCLTNAGIRALSFGINSAYFSGYGYLEDGTEVRFRVSTSDHGPGASDTISVIFDNGYSLSGTLTSGDIRIF